MNRAPRGTGAREGRRPHPPARTGTRGAGRPRHLSRRAAAPHHHEVEASSRRRAYAGGEPRWYRGAVRLREPRCTAATHKAGNIAPKNRPTGSESSGCWPPDDPAPRSASPATARPCPNPAPSGSRVGGPGNEAPRHASRTRAASPSAPGDGGEQMEAQDRVPRRTRKACRSRCRRDIPAGGGGLHGHGVPDHGSNEEERVPRRRRYGHRRDADSDSDHNEAANHGASRQSPADQALPASVAEVQFRVPFIDRLSGGR